MEHGTTDPPNGNDPLLAEAMHIIPNNDPEEMPVLHQPPKSPWKQPPDQSTQQEPATSPHIVDMDSAPPATPKVNGILS